MVLKKGKFYAGFFGGQLSYGTYIGKTPTHFAFTSSAFAGDHGRLSKTGVPINSTLWFLIEIPDSLKHSETQAFEFLKKALPE